MDLTLSLGWMQAEARSRQTSYRRILRLALVVEAAVGLAALVAPAWFSSLLGMPPVAEIPPTTGWARAWGGLLLLAAALQVPALLDPVRRRWGNAIGIVGRLLLALFLYLPLGGGFLWLALAEGGLGLALAVLYFGLFRAELMSRP